MIKKEKSMDNKIFSRIMGKFFVRTFISYVVIIALVLSLIYFFSQDTIRNFYIGNLKTKLTQVGHSLMPKTKELFGQNQLEKLDNLVKEIGSEIDIRITVIAPDGTVMADSEKDPAEMENHGSRPEIIRAMKGEVQDATRFSSTMGEQMLYLALPVLQESGETHFVLRLSLYLKEIKQLTRELKGKFIAAVLVLFLLTVLIAWYFSRGFSEPVRQIAAATREFASGNFNVKIFVKKRDELGEVARSFNNMVEEQRALFNELKERRRELQAIISSMKEGLLVLSKDGKITLCNESFEAIAGRKDLIGVSYWEALRIAGFEEYVKKATIFKSGESLYEEIEISDRTYLVGFTPLQEGEKVVIIFRDITDFKRLEQMKRDFVVNLTHELKTPLTAIKGFVETLEEEEDIKNTNYIEIIKRHTDRMNQIVSDLMLLSELEEKKRDEMDFRPLDFAEIVENILKIHREKINEKQLRLEVDIEKKLPVFNGEKFKIEQMFINLIDNAVKYTDSGSISIKIEKSKEGRSIKITATNTGLLIPQESLGRIFERFYVVDKSRSRQLGGTGLGLSIVKHVVLLHSGEISVTSSKEQGTVFTITFPLRKNK